MSFKSEAAKIEPLFLELHGFRDRFGKLKLLVDDTTVRVGDLSGAFRHNDRDYRSKVDRAASAERSLQTASWEAAAFGENIEKVIAALEEAHDDLKN